MFLYIEDGVKGSHLRTWDLVDTVPLFPVVLTRALTGPPYREMTVLLDGCIAPYREVVGLARECGLIYGMLWQSAAMDKRVHRDGSVMGGTTEWSVKGLARECHLGKHTVSRALSLLADEGYIQLLCWTKTPGNQKRVWRVTRPDQLEAVRYAIDVMGPPSERANFKTPFGVSSNDQDEASKKEAWEVDTPGQSSCGVDLSGGRSALGGEEARDEDLATAKGGSRDTEA